MIKGVTGFLKKLTTLPAKLFWVFGDDESAIDIGNQQLLLLATDGMWES